MSVSRLDDEALLREFAAIAGADAFDVKITRDDAGTPVVDVPSRHWSAAASYARHTLGMDFLDWLSAVDEPAAEPPGLDVVLHVADSTSASLTGGTPGRMARLLLRTRVTGDLRLPSLTPVWAGAAWHERETFEMFGVVFDDFVDAGGQGLRPLLLPEGFEGTPLRKSFMLAARAAKVWPGGKDPGESSAEAGASTGRRKVQPPGVPDPYTWGPRRPGEVLEPPPPSRPQRAARTERPARAHTPAPAASPAPALTPAPVEPPAPPSPDADPATPWFGLPVLAPTDEFSVGAGALPPLAPPSSVLSSAVLPPEPPSSGRLPSSPSEIRAARMAADAPVADAPLDEAATSTDEVGE